MALHFIHTGCTSQWEVTSVPVAGNRDTISRFVVGFLASKHCFNLAQRLTTNVRIFFNEHSVAAHTGTLRLSVWVAPSRWYLWGLWKDKRPGLILWMWDVRIVRSQRPAVTSFISGGGRPIVMFCWGLPAGEFNDAHRKEGTSGPHQRLSGDSELRWLLAASWPA